MLQSMKVLDFTLGPEPTSIAESPLGGSRFMDFISQAELISALDAPFSRFQLAISLYPYTIKLPLSRLHRSLIFLCIAKARIISST
jgi:hypothetical protein